MQARISKKFRVWRKYSRRYTDHVEVADAFLERVGATQGDALHRMVENILAQSRLSHDEEVARLKKYRRLGKQEDFDNVCLPILWSALRPLLSKPIYDQVFEDAFQQSALLVVDHLKTMDIEPRNNWITASSLCPMNARMNCLIDGQAAVSLPHARNYKPVRQLFERKGGSINQLDDEVSWDILRAGLTPERTEMLHEIRSAVLPESFSAEGHEESFGYLDAADIDTSIDVRRLIEWAEVNLPHREMKIIRERILDPDERSLADIGAELGLTSERVRQLYNEAIRKLKEAWDDELHAAPLKKAPAVGVTKPEKGTSQIKRTIAPRNAPLVSSHGNSGEKHQTTEAFTAEKNFLSPKTNPSSPETERSSTLAAFIENRSQSFSLSLKELLTSGLRIPTFQRTYDWREDQVQQLWDDLIEKFNAPGRPSTSVGYERHLGDITTWQESSCGPYHLIDGQQRLTTLTMLAHALRGHLARVRETNGLSSEMMELVIMRDPATFELEPKLISGDIKQTDFLRWMATQDSLPIDVDQLEEYAHELREGAGRKDSLSRIVDAFRFMSDRLDEEFPVRDDLNHHELIRFYRFFCECIRFTVTVHASRDNAIEQFEGKNNRGAGLTSADLLKNMIFGTLTSMDQETRISDLWGKINSIIELSSPEGKSFLRYVALSDAVHDLTLRDPSFGKKLTKDNVYREFFQNDDVKAVVAKNPERTVRSILGLAGIYRRLKAGEDPRGTPCDTLERMKIFNLSLDISTIVFFAARNFNSEMFSRFARMIEDVNFVKIATRTQLFGGKDFIDWVPTISAIRTEEDLDHFRDTVLVPHVRQFREKFRLELELVRYGKHNNKASARKRVNYVLAMLEEHCQRSMGRQYCPAVKVQKTRDIEVEHIRPDPMFADSPDIEIAEGLGNLTLLTRSENSSIQDAPFALKAPIYRDSTFFITSVLSIHPEVGQNNQAARGLASVEPPEPPASWDDEAIIERLNWILHIGTDHIWSGQH